MAQPVSITRQKFLEDRQGRTFADVANDKRFPFDAVIEFFGSADRQRRMQESETHHGRAPLAGVVKELEALPAVHKFLGTKHPRNSQRFRQAIGVVVRIIMEGHDWRKSGKKGSLGVRSTIAPGTPSHNSGGLAFWFIRAERYESKRGPAFISVRKRCRDFESTKAPDRNGKPESRTKKGSPKRPN